MVESIVNQCTEAPTTTASSAVNTMKNSEAEELIRNAFEELDRERARRLELEAELKALQENAKKEKEKAASTSSPSSSSRKSERKSRRRSSKSSSVKEDAAAAAAAAAATSSSPSKNNNNQVQPAAMIPPKHYTALQQELEGYRQIVNAMTQEKPAIAAAIKASSDRRSAIRTGRPIPHQRPTPPLHVVRLLEIMPWEPKAQEHAFATEDIYEWQVYNVKQQKWCHGLNQFPSFFQALPTIKSTNKVQEYQPLDSMNMPGRDRSMLMFLAGCENMGSSGKSSSSTSPPLERDSVLTNAGLTHLMDIASGFPLPHDGGTWQWVGGWRIEKRVIVFVNNGETNAHGSAAGAGGGSDSSRRTLDCDEEGWSYVFDASDFLKENPEKHCYERPGMVEDKISLEKSFLSGNKVVRHLIPLRQVRRRKWTRRRVLVDYPYASEQSKHFLSLLAQNASLTFAANKISDELVDVKMKLTETQLKTHQNEEETKLQIAQLKQEITVKEQTITKLKQKKKAEKKATTQKPSSSSSNSSPNKTGCAGVKSSLPSSLAAAAMTSTMEKMKQTERSDIFVEKDSVAEKDSGVEKTKEENKINKESTEHQQHQQGHDLRELVSQWVSTNTNKLKVISNELQQQHFQPDVANSSDSENPVSDASATSTTVPEDDESLLLLDNPSSSVSGGNSAAQVESQSSPEGVVGAPAAHDDDNDNDGNRSCSRRNSTSSTNSQDRISFDWKKLGRDTIEKFKQLGKDSAHDHPPQVVSGESTPRSPSPTQEEVEEVEEESSMKGNAMTATTDDLDADAMAAGAGAGAGAQSPLASPNLAITA